MDLISLMIDLIVIASRKKRVLKKKSTDDRNSEREWMHDTIQSLSR